LQVLQLDLCGLLAQVTLQLNLRTLPCCKGARKIVLCSAHCRARHCARNLQFLSKCICHVTHFSKNLCFWIPSLFLSGQR
jgi:hypothetical protein